ncbi:MAG: UbiX family flavin prenyltransferase [Nitrospinae bacterium]|nr:UbiX family flavin prenyltransferase [Nitrospinota bacterium]
MSGASGAVYGKEIFDRLVAARVETHLVITATAQVILKDEMDIPPGYFNRAGVTVHDNGRYDVPIASGSFLTAGMVVAPCSMGCLARIASGVSTDLLERAADVHLKERRPLILVPRETPLSDIHLENMLRISRAGGTILPAMPAFTHRPKTIEELAAFIAGRVFDHLKLPQDFTPRYTG